jgi:hypothetical protein
MKTKTTKTPVITPKKKVGRPKKEIIPPEQTKDAFVDDDYNLFSYMVPQPEQRQKISKTTKLYIGQKYRKYKPDDPNYDLEFRVYLTDNNINPNDVKGMTKPETIQYVYDVLNGISQPIATIPTTDETSFDYGQTFLKDPYDEILNRSTNPLSNNSGGSVVLNKPPENIESLLESVNTIEPLPDTITKRFTRSTNKPKSESVFDEIKTGKQLKKTEPNVKKPPKEKSAMEKAMDSRRKFIKEDDDDNNSDDDSLKWV